MKCEIAENQSGAAIVVHCGPDEVRVYHSESKVDENGKPIDEFDVCAKLLEAAIAKVREAKPTPEENARRRRERGEVDVSEIQVQKAGLGLFEGAGHPTPYDPGLENVPLEQTPPQGGTVPQEMPQYQRAMEKLRREAEEIAPLHGGRKDSETDRMRAEFKRQDEEKSGKASEQKKIEPPKQEAKPKDIHKPEEKRDEGKRKGE